MSFRWAALVLCTVFLYPTHATDLPLRYVYDFERGTLGDLAISGNAPTVTSSVARSGRHGMRSSLDRLKDSTSFRTEVRIPGLQEVGGEYWIGISIRVSDDWVPSNFDEILFQIHDRPNDWDNPPGSRNPPVALRTIGGSGVWEFINRWNPVHNADKRTQVDVVKEKLGKVVPGEWVDWVFHFRWDWRENGRGLTQVWKNGQLVVDYRGPNYYNDNYGPYVKFGIYKAGWRDRKVSDTIARRVIFHDEYREAGADGSYELVAPGGAPPAVSRPRPPKLNVDWGPSSLTTSN